MVWAWLAASVAVVVSLCWFASRKGGSHDAHDGDNSCDAPPAISCDTCAGDSVRCGRDCLLEASAKPIEYFDDEELDSFAGRPSSEYTDDETAMFAEVLYTMRPEEVERWCRSLTLRGIDLPDQLKDEVVMMIDR